MAAGGVALRCCPLDSQREQWGRHRVSAPHRRVLGLCSQHSRMAHQTSLILFIYLSSPVAVVSSKSAVSLGDPAPPVPSALRLRLPLLSPPVTRPHPPPPSRILRCPVASTVHSLLQHDKHTRPDAR